MPHKRNSWSALAHFSAERTDLLSSAAMRFSKLHVATRTSCLGVNILGTRCFQSFTLHCLLHAIPLARARSYMVCLMCLLRVLVLTCEAPTSTCSLFGNTINFRGVLLNNITCPKEVPRPWMRRWKTLGYARLARSSGTCFGSFFMCRILKSRRVTLPLERRFFL